MAINVYDSKEKLDNAIIYWVYQHLGEANAIDRWDLVRAVFGNEAAPVLIAGNAETEESDVNRFDRRLRGGIERLRNKGHIICNMGDGSGYYIANTAAEYQEFRQKYGRHAFPIIQTIHRMDETAKQKWPNPLQPSMF